MTSKTAADTTPPARHQLSERFADPDLVDRIFDLVIAHLPQLVSGARSLSEAKNAVRGEFSGQEIYIHKRRHMSGEVLAQQVRELCAGGARPKDVAVKLGLSRATVYRMRGSHGKNLSHFSEK
ncbi:hypothetical protein [Caldimonas tepidiphila]|uniref:hypothetical protein n=1 Tax=Caldimonas tepidiphila TaxID=2315841 RepID=UPI001300B9EA|nr:hypothetical protein [Caldimonas tepidiphila]